MMKKNQKQYKSEDVINSVIRMIVEDKASTKTILDFLQNVLGYKETSSYLYFKKAREKIAKMFECEIKEELDKSKAQLEDMLEEAVKNGNQKIALQIRQELNKLLGLYSPEKVDITSAGDKITEIRLIQVIKKEKENE
jgi:hypothetical protein